MFWNNVLNHIVSIEFEALLNLFFFLALFLLDNHHELWLWQGWWPETEEELDVLSDQTGSGAVRWQAERKAAMQTAVDYWKKLHGDDKPVVGYLVWAGMEPLKFKNLFPAWDDREDVTELNKKVIYKSPFALLHW